MFFICISLSQEKKRKMLTKFLPGSDPNKYVPLLLENKMCNVKPGHHCGTIMLQLHWYVVEQHGIRKK